MTFGLILLAEEGVKWAWGPAPLSLAPPALLAGSVTLPDGLRYGTYRLAVLGAGLAVAALLWLLIERTRGGMRLRAGASNAAMLDALGVDVGRLFALVLAFGAMLAGFAGALAAPIVSVDPSMGGAVLILAFVVIVLGGPGSMRGAFAAALLVGLTDTLGRTLLDAALRLALGPSAARMAGAALASMLIYLLMAAVLAFRPGGLAAGRGQRGPRLRLGPRGPGRRAARFARRRPADRRRHRQRLPALARHAGDGVRARGGVVAGGGGLWRAGQSRPRRLRRDRRLCLADPEQFRAGRGGALAARCGRRRRPVRVADRLDRAAGARRGVPDAHARLQPDGLFRRRLARRLWRRRRHAARSHAAAARHRPAGPAVRAAPPGPAAAPGRRARRAGARRLPLRPGAAGGAGECGAGCRARLRRAARAPHRLRAGRRRRRRRRMAARRPHPAS